MSRDFLYEHERMPTETDEQFVAMVKMARIEGRWLSSWMQRLIEIAERATKKQ
jgi:hypothetical protein